jgi:hypothetical protein
VDQRSGVWGRDRGGLGLCGCMDEAGATMRGVRTEIGTGFGEGGRVELKKGKRTANDATFSRGIVSVEIVRVRGRSWINDPRCGA